jgi:hypothetical protein
MSDLLDTAGLRAAYAELDEVARGPSGTPPPGEWDREHILAHLVSADLMEPAADHRAVARAGRRR